MLKTKPVLLFLLKSILIFSVLAAPFSFYDKMYGKFYHNIGNSLFGKFKKTGFAKFKEGKNEYTTHISVGNKKRSPDNAPVSNANADFNTRYRGYLPTAFLISLILSSPFPIKRKVLAIVTGTAILTGFIMIKQWIHILYICKQATWLKLYEFSQSEQDRIEFWYKNFANYSGSTLIVVIAIWILVSFRKSDLEALRS